MEISESDRDAYLDLLYDMYDADLVDVALDALGENELFDGIPAILEDYYYYFDEDSLQSKNSFCTFIYRQYIKYILLHKNK